jgi:hypothetical protein
MYYVQIGHMLNAIPVACSGVTVRLSRGLQLREKLMSKEHPRSLTSMCDRTVFYQFQGYYGKVYIKRVCVLPYIRM